MTDRLCLTLLGGLEIARGQAPITDFISAKVQALLCYLALTGQPHLRPALAGLLWGDMPEDRANANLRKALSNLRQVAPSNVCFVKRSVSFDRHSDCWLDVEHFERQITQARMAIDRQAPGSLSADTADTLARAANLYQGDLLAGFHVAGAPAFEEWVLNERERLRSLALYALYALLDHHAARGENDLAIEYATRLLVIDPWREDVHRYLMRLLARSGQRSAALAQYKTCQQILGREFGVEPTAETKELYDRIRASARRRVHLPPQPTPFVGRRDELAQVTHTIDNPDCRLLTLVGPGGIGKTRLALRVGETRQDAFLDGLFFVPLSGVDGPETLVPTIAAALGFSFYGRQALDEQLLNYLSNKELLLILDGFEHLVPSADLLARILERAPRVCLLVTSRIRVGLRWEWLLDVHGLAYPSEQDPPESESDAVQLFVQTASRVQAGLALADEMASITRICRLVEGMPLAIELAAAAVRERSCDQIARDVTRDMDVLSTTLQDVPRRHRSVHAAFEGSWQQLSDIEQSAFARLSVFRGGMTGTAARQISGASRTILHRLVARSLLRQESDQRYGMHTLLRQYAAARLAQSPADQQEAHAAHCTYYARFVQQREKKVRQQGQAMREMDAEIENIRAAWQHAIDTRQIKVIDALLEGMHNLFDLRGWLREGQEIFDRAAAALDGIEHAAYARGRVLIRQSLLLFRLGAYDDAQDRAERALALVQTAGDKHEEAIALSVLGVADEEQGRYDTACMRYEQSLALYHAEHDAAGLARTFDHLGHVARMVGDYAQANVYYEQGLEAAQRCGDLYIQVNAYTNLGGAAGTRGDYDRARIYFDRCLAICRENDYRYGIASACHNLGSVAFLQRDYQTAKQLRQESLSICREIGFRWGESDSLRHLADAHRELGQYAQAHQLYQESLALKQEIGHARGVALVLASMGRLNLAQGSYVQAWQHYQQALTKARELDAQPVMMSILTGMGQVMAHTGALQQALSLWSFIQQHPATEQQTLDRIAPLIADATAQAIDRPQDQARSEPEQDLSTVVESILAMPKPFATTQTGKENRS